MRLAMGVLCALLRDEADLAYMAERRRALAGALSRAAQWRINSAQLRSNAAA
jgi:hypothetical protein